MKQEKFKVIQFTREIIVTIDKELDNFPKRNIEIKNRIRGNCYDLLEILYEANTASIIERKKELLERAIAKIKVIDYLINISYDSKLISNKKYIKIGTKLDDIIKYITGWYKTLN
jgi:hypothetical protein